MGLNPPASTSWAAEITSLCTRPRWIPVFQQVSLLSRKRILSGGIMYLWHGIELHHGSSEGFCIGAERRNEPQHGSVEGAIDLRQGGRSWVIHIYNRHVAQEPAPGQHSLAPYQTQPVTPTPLNRTDVKADLGHIHCWGWCLTYHGKYTKLGIPSKKFKLNPALLWPCRWLWANHYSHKVNVPSFPFFLSYFFFFLVVVQGLNPAPTFSVSGSGALLLAYCSALTSWDGFTMSSDGLRLLFLLPHPVYRHKPSCPANNAFIFNMSSWL